MNQPRYEVTVRRENSADIVRNFFSETGARAYAVQQLPRAVEITDLETGETLHSEEPAETIAAASRLVAQGYSPRLAAILEAQTT